MCLIKQSIAKHAGNFNKGYITVEFIITLQKFKEIDCLHMSVLGQPGLSNSSGVLWNSSKGEFNEKYQIKPYIDVTGNKCRCPDSVVQCSFNILLYWERQLLLCVVEVASYYRITVQL